MSNYRQRISFGDLEKLQTKEASSTSQKLVAAAAVF